MIRKLKKKKSISSVLEIRDITFVLYTKLSYNKWDSETDAPPNMLVLNSKKAQGNTILKVIRTKGT